VGKFHHVTTRLRLQIEAAERGLHALNRFEGRAMIARMRDGNCVAIGTDVYLSRPRLEGSQVVQMEGGVDTTSTKCWAGSMLYSADVRTGVITPRNGKRTNPGQHLRRLAGGIRRTDQLPFSRENGLQLQRLFSRRHHRRSRRQPVFFRAKEGFCRTNFCRSTS
jgi:hypothetical protein